MKISWDERQRGALRAAHHTDPDPGVRRRAGWLLALASGAPLARVARGAGVSRPTVYRYARAWRALGTPLALLPGVAARLDRARVRATSGGPGSPTSPARTS